VIQPKMLDYVVRVEEQGIVSVVAAMAVAAVGDDADSTRPGGQDASGSGLPAAPLRQARLFLYAAAHDFVDMLSEKCSPAHGCRIEP
jgi:hypothetical protein